MWRVTKGLEIGEGGVSLLPPESKRQGSTLALLCDIGKVTPPLCVSVSTSGHGAGGNRECEGWEAP